MDASVISGVTLACAVTLAGFILLLVVCIKKVPKYNRNKVQYKEVKYDDDEGDDSEDVLAEFNP